jgi:hypothetical protein
MIMSDLKEEYMMTMLLLVSLQFVYSTEETFINASTIIDNQMKDLSIFYTTYRFNLCNLFH